ncbi:MAG TPA: class I SAM-dependent methyltransferase, partial [Dehalococcoidia bacterium]|nr:class I SAM-dependent methyltransferase [Dehalococcoidia bacterium]
MCNNALMDMPTIQPLADSLCRRLKPNGRFVFSVPHPCFNAVST